MSRYVGKKKDEIFLGNRNIKNGDLLSTSEHHHLLKTIRLGDQALDIDGHPLDKNQYLPVFIHQSEAELYDKIMMHLTYPDSPRWKM